MALKTIKLPDIGEGVAEAEVTEWHVAVGDHVVEDQILAAVMTDKATVEIPSPFAGRITHLGGAVGDVLAVGGPLVELDVDSGASAAVSPPAAQSVAAARPKPQTGVAPAPSTAPKSTVPAAPAPIPQDAAESKATHRPLASPAVRRRALEAGLDLRQVAGTGPAHRVTHEDLDRFAKGERVRNNAVFDEPGRTETIKLVGLRRRIAERMADANRRVAHFSYIEEVDVTALEELRARLNERYSRDRTQLTLLPFIVRAIVLAVGEFPQMNALYDDEAETLTQHSAVHVGVATQTNTGLLVPVLRNAQRLGLWECAAEIRRLAEAARSGTSTRSELGGSTITITSLGALGGLATTPMINPPEVAIVGVNRISIRPVWLHNQFVPRTMMNLSSSFDHRIVDGDGAARFVQAIKGYLELPATLFVE